ncbi:MAG: hypothetical protein P1S60_06195, partial [Anaerolineae bacterium]|nr:hypothetical protein [Anaerolineae bacterium]
QTLCLSSPTPGALGSRVQIHQKALNFSDFLKIFEVLRPFFVSKAWIQRITREIIEDAAQDNVRYLELRVNPLALAEASDFDLNDVVEWIMQAAEGSQVKTGTRTCLIIQIPRKETLVCANTLVDIAIAHQGVLMRGIDLAGDEKSYPADKFSVPFQRAYDAGLCITVHAGETTCADTIHTAITHLHAQRIGHGLSAVSDAALLELLRERGTILEICPTSNIKTSLVSDYEHHPLAVMDEYGLRITVNTDDPSIFTTTSSQEIIAAVCEIGIPMDHIYQYLRYGVEGAFIPDDERPWLRQLFRKALSAFPGATQAYDQAAD